MIVSNSSPLIYLAKINRLNLLKLLFNKIFIPEEVYTEVVINGKQRNFSDALSIERAIKDGWIEVKKTNYNFEYDEIYNKIHLGEIEAIKLAKQLNAKLLLIDDASAHTLAQGLGLNVKGAIYVLLTAYEKKLINKNEIKSCLYKLVLHGFRISTELYGKILNEIG
ncbi:MAG: DUF3368 domain-containing protein [Nanoarchaeota archaeon]